MKYIYKYICSQLQLRLQHRQTKVFCNLPVHYLGNFPVLELQTLLVAPRICLTGLKTGYSNSITEPLHLIRIMVCFL